MEVSEKLLAQLASLPGNPGVYLMRDAKGTVVYVGKAINLRNRVRSYFREDKGHSPKVRAMVRQVDHFETLSTDTEIEALVLENTLIKRHQPYFNILLKDDKTYPWLKLTREPFPRLMVTRRKVADQARYFGPYPDTQAMYASLRLIRSLFPLRQRPKPQFRDRPCLNYAIGRCPGPCQAKVSAEEYDQVVARVVAFLEGRHRDLVRDLRARMLEASDALDFEKAGKLRDALAAIDRLMEDQKVVSERDADWDLVAIALDEHHAAVQLFQVREGQLTGRRSFGLDRQDADPAEVLRAFLMQHYAEIPEVPREILVGQWPADHEILAQWLSEKRGRKVTLGVPQRGDKLKLLEMVAYNAQQVLEQERLRRWAAQEKGSERGLAELAEALGLSEPPKRIEGYDIAHVQGSDTVASMVVFEDGKPAKGEYRRFKIRSVTGVDDFASMREVVARRFAHREGGKATAWALPDLVLIDGGKGQLSSALAAIAQAGVELPVFGLAKRFEEILLPGQSEPIRLAPASAALALIQRVRDEAHRFANAFHGQQRSARMTRSLLDEVPGLGPQRRRKLLKTLESVEAMRGLSLDALMAAGTLPRPVTEALYAALHPELAVHEG